MCSLTTPAMPKAIEGLAQVIQERLSDASHDAWNSQEIHDEVLKAERSYSERVNKLKTEGGLAFGVAYGGILCGSGMGRETSSHNRMGREILALHRRAGTDWNARSRTPGIPPLTVQTASFELH